jgi:curved DNA-binding protein CbpA
MKSAYTVLGIPGNASTADIEQAYAKAVSHYSKDPMAGDARATQQLSEIRDAYKLLQNPEMRSAHDRKLSAAVNQPAAVPARFVMQAAAPAWYTKPLVVMGLVVVTLFAIGSYMSHSRDQVRKVQLAQEMAQKQLDAEAASKAEAERNQLAQDRARSAANDQNRERQLRSDSNNIARNAAYATQAQQASIERQIQNDKRDLERKESQAKQDERQRAYEAQRRLAQDQARIRELCMLQYRTPVC